MTPRRGFSIRHRGGMLDRVEGHRWESRVLISLMTAATQDPPLQLGIFYLVFTLENMSTFRSESKVV
jgi:hypothetical protein